MATTVILSADLYENVLTEKQGDYTAKPRITGTVRNEDIAASIVEERTEFRKETIINILQLADQKKIKAIAEGKSLVDGFGQYLLNINGSFEGEKPKFDSSIHQVGITFTPGKDLQESLKNIDFTVSLATTGPVINTVTDSATNQVNLSLTPNSPAVLSGDLLLVKGDDPSNGIYFTEDKTDGATYKVQLIVRNTNSEVILQVPNLPDGQYYLSITTQAGGNYKMVKTPRTYKFPILLTVGEVDNGGDDDDMPDEL